MTNSALLREYIEKSGLKISFIAESIGVSRAALWKKLNNRSSFNQYEIERLCNILEIKSLRVKDEIFFAKM